MPPTCSHRWMICRSLWNSISFQGPHGQEGSCRGYNNLGLRSVCVCTWLHTEGSIYMCIRVSAYPKVSVCAFMYPRVHRFGECLLSVRLGVHLGPMCIFRRALGVFTG